MNEMTAFLTLGYDFLRRYFLQMKRASIRYWIFTALLTAFMLLGAIPDWLQTPEAVSWLAHLGYPAYILPFLGAAKIFGLIAILVPGFSRLKEWAYAGLTFDLLGALYSHLFTGDKVSNWIFPVIGLFLVTGSYISYRSKTGLDTRSDILVSLD